MMADDNGPWYDGLIEEFDRVHRGRAIDNRKNVVAMRMRGHAANDFPYDMRYEPYIARLGMLPFVLQFKRKPPPVNHAVLTALTDRWRPETHSFHLPCGEMAMTLEDMAMISGLPLNGDAVTGHVIAVNWRQRVGVLIGVEPPPPLPDEPDASKVKHSWLKELDQTSMRTRESSSLCGFVWSLIMWERLSVGRPMLKNPDNPNPNPHEGLHDEDPYSRPTVAYHWDQVSIYTGNSHVRYKCYMNELDTLTAEQVFRRSYEEDRGYDLNQMCTRDNNMWRSRCPMICFCAVEFHFVDRVARIFGKRQGIPTEETRSVITSLHG
ncbi:Alpha-L-arabinofuranosidase 1 [Hordeum vulgare]|nr:Alpha-L-arabinofuranosidase 1 [Hordeum vulgare]